ncbi:37S ribosomal protein S12, mitochondrial [Yamadazyma tenuis]|uniref:Ribosomal protein S12 n=1 Tax=Candida tenuis (strain ATCC 10573 / BCRC 21748 / CBS 615 / JCM 9827 / NBRC 10315 / NRRL Y-1498 / VKM Y-70) TaxID=590646 RepID=G3B637_CANTC|nr:uncharacterized protein CANTEDRAFT_106029 [Yamadazyma tenuis ATCC 10573]EGV63370.1 hypothetical protein CANTEDRAFT_106029 [Yamadazyma tenuis ATCC 10573]WEJ96803.1 37S ribosomal protein S12, mitochondrial [Yamadazyma tenuis]
MFRSLISGIKVVKPALSSTNYVSSIKQNVGIQTSLIPQAFNYQKRYATLNQIKSGKQGIPNKPYIPGAPHLQGNPFKKGVVLRVMIVKPKKPNSAQRKCCRVRLTNGNVITALIPGEGHNLQEHHVVLVRGGKVQDLPGVNYKLVRGAYDLNGVANRATSRSKYGVKKPQQ